MKNNQNYGWDNCNFLLLCLLFYLNINSNKYVIFKYIIYDNLFKKHRLCIIYYYNFMFLSDLSQILPVIQRGIQEPMKLMHALNHPTYGKV